MAPSTHLISTAEAAQLLGRSVGTVNRWAANGRLTTVAKVPGPRGARFFDRAEVEALAAKN